MKEHRGAWPTFDDQFIKLSDICQLWDDCKNKRSRLMIVLDSCFSGSWVSLLKHSRGYNDISIQSSCDAREFCCGDDEGGTFTKMWIRLQSNEYDFSRRLSKHAKFFSQFHIREHILPSSTNYTTSVFKTVTRQTIFFVNIGSMRPKVPSIPRFQLTLDDYVVPRRS